MATNRDDTPLFCARCGAELTPGEGEYFRVNIEAVADPAPPVIAEQDPASIRREIEELLERMEDVSAQEAMDQVYRRLTIFLCGNCYRPWIEDPTG